MSGVPDKYAPWGFVGYINMLRAPDVPYVPLPLEILEREKRDYLERLAASRGVHWS